MAVKTLLVMPPRTVQTSGSVEAHLPPLGLAYLAAYLEKHKKPVKIVDAVAEGFKHREPVKKDFVRIGLTEKQLRSRLKKYKPDVVGIACMFTAFKDDSFRVAKIVKDEMPKSVVVFGGAHVSANPEATAFDKNVDIALFGEGEQTLLEIVEALEKGKKPSGIAGTVSGFQRVKRNKPRELFRNLDELPFPARHLLPMPHYFELQKKAYSYSMRFPIVEIITSRGCPGKCIFCAVHTIWGRCWRPRSAKNVVDEIEHCMKKYGIREFNFTDDNVSLSKKRMIEICKEIVNRNLDIRWQTPNGIAIWTLDSEVLQWMKKSGYYRAKFGLETGSKKMQRYIGKNIDLEHAKKVIEECNRLGIWTASSFIIGFPNETKQDINKTVEFAKTTHLDFARFLIAQPYEGTDLYEEFAQRKLLEKGKTKASSAYYTTYSTSRFSASELNALRKQAHKGFLKSRMHLMLNPKFFAAEFLPKIGTPEKFCHFVKNGLMLARDNALKKAKKGK